VSGLRINDTVKKSFSLLKKDPTIILLFILPAMFPIERIIANYLMVSIMLGPPGLPSMPSIPLFVLYSIAGFLLGVWASAGAILKVTELEKRSKLGLKDALFKGLKKIPKLLVPAIVSFAIYILMIFGLTIAINLYMLIEADSLIQSEGPSVIVLLVAMGCLFIAVLYIAIRLRLAAPACVVENNFGLKTSWKLVKGSWWKLFAILLIFGVMSALISRIPIAGIFLCGFIVGPPNVTATTLIYRQLREEKSIGEEHKESL
jgi:hypothetical protein